MKEAYLPNHGLFVGYENGQLFDCTALSPSMKDMEEDGTPLWEPLINPSDELLNDAKKALGLKDSFFP